MAREITEISPLRTFFGDFLISVHSLSNVRNIKTAPVPNNNNGSNTPKTGSDYIAVIFSISLLTVSGAAIAALVLLSKKRGKHVAK